MVYGEGIDIYCRLPEEQANNRYIVDSVTAKINPPTGGKVPRLAWAKISPMSMRILKAVSNMPAVRKMLSNDLELEAGDGAGAGNAGASCGTDDYSGRH